MRKLSIIPRFLLIYYSFIANFAQKCVDMDKRIIECVPNFSVGRDEKAINLIAQSIRSVNGVKLLHVDQGEAANRTVYTFAGTPDGVVEAAFQAAKTAAELIDMRTQHGTHPRIGATDVLPLVPVAGISLEECADMARKLAKRMADELGIPCYAYEAAAFKPERRNLAVCRRGEYEALHDKLYDEKRRPDFMPPDFPYDGSVPESVQRTGCSVVGARDFLIAVNFNLNSKSTEIAKEIASDVREKGRQAVDEKTGKLLFDESGKKIMIPGSLKSAKAIGWYIDEYGIAQVSMNLTNMNVTPLHVAFEEVSRCAEKRGVKVTGTEIIGLVPKKALVEAGCYFLEKDGKPINLPESEIIQYAIKFMTLDDLKPFNPKEKVIEYLL